MTPAMEPSTWNGRRPRKTSNGRQYVGRPGDYRILPLAGVGEYEVFQGRWEEVKWRGLIFVAFLIALMVVIFPVIVKR